MSLWPGLWGCQANKTSKKLDTFRLWKNSLPAPVVRDDLLVMGRLEPEAFV